MRVYYLFFAFLFSFEINAQTNDSIMLRKIYDHYLTESISYKNLEYLATKFGGRLSGSKKAEEAVYWAKKALYDAGADTVYLQPCTVPHWERGGKEICKVVSPGAKNGQLAVVALGSSTCTPKRSAPDCVSIQ